MKRSKPPVEPFSTPGQDLLASERPLSSPAGSGLGTALQASLGTLTRRPSGTSPPPFGEHGSSRAHESMATWIPDLGLRAVVDRPAEASTPTETAPPELVAEFLVQLTPDLRRRGLRSARRRAALVRQAGRRVDRLYAEELFQDALTDIWTGQIAWDPAECDLLTCVRREMRRRAWLDVRRARRFSHHRLDEVPRTDDPRKMQSIENEVSLAQGVHASQGDLTPLLIRSVARAAHAELRRMAGRDRAMNAILDCWADGVTDRADVLDRTALSFEEYRLARRKLAKLVDRLSPELHENADDLLRSAS